MPLEPANVQPKSLTLSGTATQRLTVALCAASMLVAVTSIGVETASGLELIGWLAASVIAVLIGGRLGAVMEPSQVAHRASLAVLTAYGVSLVAEPVIRVFGYGRPLELILFEGFLATLPVFAFTSVIRRWVSLAGTASLFAVLFAVCVQATPAVAVLAACWSVLATVWLMTLVRDISSGEQIGTRHSGGKRWLFVLPVALVALVIAGTSSGRDSLSLSQGFLWSSGGDGEGDQNARDGVGDGDALVAATTQAESFGPVEDAPFARSDEPSLYDLFDESYGEPLDWTKTDRAVSLAPEDVLSGENEMAEAESAGREFSTLRKPRTELRGGVGDLASAAMLYVSGRVPLHLRMQVFENFDGVVWSENSPRKAHTPEVAFDVVDEKPWLLVPQPTRAFDSVLSPPEAHAIKPIHFDETRIPAPPNVTAIHIDQVSKKSLFEWVQEDIVKMKRERLAKSVPIHVASRRVDLDQIDEALPAIAIGGRHELHALPRHPQMKDVRRLAKEWTEGTKSGWRQVEQLTQKLREHAVIDRDAVASAESDFPVGEFLFETRRGPDYQFATAACLMLRSLGYPTRVVTGFYANPEKYDLAGRHTYVDGEDVHTWCEVRLGGRCWATVEPSPGYEVLLPPRSLWYRVKSAAVELAIALAKRWPVGLVIALIGAVMWWTRVEWTDLCCTIRHIVWRRQSSPQVVWRLIERRLDAVCPNTPGCTPRRRIDELNAPTEVKSLLADLVSRAESGVFSGVHSLEPSRKDAEAADHCVKCVTLRELRRWKHNEAVEHTSV